VKENQNLIYQSEILNVKRVSTKIAKIKGSNEVSHIFICFVEHHQFITGHAVDVGHILYLFPTDSSSIKERHSCRPRIRDCRGPKPIYI
jgi:hypothetical protein